MSLPATGRNHTKSHRTEFNKRMGRCICGCGWRGKRVNSRKHARNLVKLRNKIGSPELLTESLEQSDLQGKADCPYSDLPVFLVVSRGTS